MDTSKNRSRRREERNLEDGVWLGLHLGICLTFGSDLGWTACGMIAWFGPGWITLYEEEKKEHYRRRKSGIETSTALRETFGRLL